MLQGSCEPAEPAKPIDVAAFLASMPKYLPNLPRPGAVRVRS